MYRRDLGIWTCAPQCISHGGEGQSKWCAYGYRAKERRVLKRHVCSCTSCCPDRPIPVLSPLGLK
eukprot:29081-Eustigmatos_ZCMA.PRE.1